MQHDGTWFGSCTWPGVQDDDACSICHEHLDCHVLPHHLLLVLPRALRATLTRNSGSDNPGRERYAVNRLAPGLSFNAPLLELANNIMCVMLSGLGATLGSDYKALRLVTYAMSRLGLGLRYTAPPFEPAGKMVS